MTEQKLGFVDQLKSYPRTFWVANTMEIFERMSWYGWFTVMALYVTGPVETGGLGFTTETRGLLQAIVPFCLYLMPVLTGALADHFGFKKMLTLAYLVMVVSYYLLGQFYTLPTFFMAFMFVAVGAAIFKPVIVGTVARVTNDSNSSTAFGIFYMMVNIGGFAGPIVAGLVRGQGWEWVFIACSGWAAVNLVIVLLFYREPPAAGPKRTLSKVFDDLVEVLGNLRFFITVGVVLIALMVSNIQHPSLDWFTGQRAALFCVLWVALNFIWDLAMPVGSGRPHRGDGPKRFFLFKRMHCSNWRFALFLLIMSGFWTSFNQIFYTMPEYIRDFTETRPLIGLAETVLGESDLTDPNVGAASTVATISEDERNVVVTEIEKLVSSAQAGELTDELLHESAEELLQSKVRLAPSELRALVTGAPSQLDAAITNALRDLMSTRDTAVATCMASADAGGESADARWQSCVETWRSEQAELFESASGSLTASLQAIASTIPVASPVTMSAGTLADMASSKGSAEVGVRTNNAIIAGRQFNPEFIVNINAGAIVLFQVMVSFLMARFHRFTTMIVGMVIASVGIGFSTFAGGEGFVGIGSVVWIVAGGIFIFSFGEMMASPTSQEYVGRIAPDDKKALYMGYYFVAVALGNLFGGILSGQLYGRLARDMQRPDLMWLSFGGIMLLTAIIFLLYNKLALPKHAANSLTNNAAE